MTAAPAAAGGRCPDEFTPQACLQRELDALLFTADGWFTIDASNRKVPGVTPGTLDQALALVGQGAVATVVGRLRPEVAGIDVDASGALGDTVARTVRDWCADRRLWHLLRPSGGGPGRWHILLVPGVHREELAVLLDQLRRELRLTSRHLDLRTQLRPLTAPHRRRGATPPPDGLEHALTDLQSVLQPTPADVLARRCSTTPARRPRRQSTAGGPAAPLRPLPRPRRELPTSWATYLTHGRRAAAAVDRDPTTRSQIELEATSALVRAGYSEPEAWAAINASHPTAFTKARSRGRRWWWHVWNRCVHDADRWLTARRRATTTAPAPRPATTAARAALEATWRSWPTRTRHVDREVLTVILDRLDRTRTDEAAIAQRDLVEDCAVASRTTVRAALARLQAAGLLQVLATYQPGTTDTAHTLRVPDHSPTHHPSGSTGRDAHTDAVTNAALPIDPSSVQPPQRRLALPLRHALGLRTSTLLSYLPAAGEPAAGISALAAAAGLLEPGQTDPTPQQVRTVRQHLHTLARYGLATVDAHGHWQAEPASMAAAELQRVGQERIDEALLRVADERREFRERMHGDARRARWEHQREATLVRQAEQARARQKAWWAQLPTEQRERRRTAYAAAFNALPAGDQARHKHHRAAQRARAGEQERRRYDHWLQGMDADELARRSSDRATAYAQRPAHEQQQLVASWAEHRARWRLPHPQRPGSSTANVSPATARWPEAHLLTRQAPTVDELVLFDRLETTRHDPRSSSARAAGG